MKKLLIACFILVFGTVSAYAGDPPKFFQDTYPDYALKSALEARGILEGSEAQLDAKTRQLIALGVAAQVPCAYCVYAHTKQARAAGATEGEIREAVATAATVRQWSTVLNGMAYDLEAFKEEVDNMQPSN
jgi:AhpD family alkylhydroperoxidase